MREMNSQAVLSKVPAVTLGFWIIKILATTLGETGGDTVTMTMDLGYLIGTAIFLTALVVLVIAQIAAKKFPAPLLGNHHRLYHRGHNDGGFRGPFAWHRLYGRNDTSSGLRDRLPRG